MLTAADNPLFVMPKTPDLKPIVQRSLDCKSHSSPTIIGPKK